MRNYLLKMLAAALILTFAGCEKNSDIELPQPTVREVDANATKALTRSSQIAQEEKGNPYSVTSMRMAFDELVEQGEIESAASSDELFITTDYYVRFSPKSRSELQELLELDNIDLYPFPIDNESDSQPYTDDVFDSVDYNGDIDDDDDTDEEEDSPLEGVYYYAAISALKNPIPDYDNYEILEELFIPNNAPETTRGGVSISPDIVEKVLAKSFEITNNAESYIAPVSTVSTMGVWWQPSGRITVYDDIARDYIGLEGVKVRARCWFETYSGITDSKGYFTCNLKTIFSVNYLIVWSGTYWTIHKKNGLLPVYTSALNQRSALNLKIKESDEELLRIATIHRALYRVYHKYIDVLVRPIYDKKLKIAYTHGINTENPELRGVFHPKKTFLQPDIDIYGKTYGEWRQMSSIFSTTCHELAHAAYYLSAPKSTIMEADQWVKDGWARCVEYVITNLEYKELGLYEKLNSYKEVAENITMMIPNNTHNFQTWNKVDNSQYKYAPLFIDLIDDYNQQEYYRLSDPDSDYQKYPYDAVKDFPLKYLQKIAFESKNFEDVKQWVILILDITYPDLPVRTYPNYYRLFEGYEL